MKKILKCTLAYVLSFIMVFSLVPPVKVWAEPAPMAGTITEEELGAFLDVIFLLNPSKATLKRMVFDFIMNYHFEDLDVEEIDLLYNLIEHVELVDEMEDLVDQLEEALTAFVDNHNTTRDNVGFIPENYQPISFDPTSIQFFRTAIYNSQNSETGGALREVSSQLNNATDSIYNQLILPRDTFDLVEAGVLVWAMGVSIHGFVSPIQPPGGGGVISTILPTVASYIGAVLPDISQWATDLAMFGIKVIHF